MDREIGSPSILSVKLISLKVPISNFRAEIIKCTAFLRPKWQYFPPSIDFILTLRGVLSKVQASLGNSNLVNFFQIYNIEESDASVVL